jgi:hypothetical protein
LHHPHFTLWDIYSHLKILGDHLKTGHS